MGTGQKTSINYIKQGLIFIANVGRGLRLENGLIVAVYGPVYGATEDLELLFVELDLFQCNAVFSEIVRIYPVRYKMPQEKINFWERDDVECRICRCWRYG